jgi:hypothetical protein
VLHGWQASDSTDGDTASLAERLRRTGEVVDDACLRRRGCGSACPQTTELRRDFRDVMRHESSHV